jgi:hypothetical protein
LGHFAPKRSQIGQTLENLKSSRAKEIAGATTQLNGARIALWIVDVGKLATLATFLGMKASLAFGSGQI